MAVGPWLDTAWPVFTPDPVNPHHPLNQGRRAWWLTLPSQDGGRQWFDLLGRHHGTLTNIGSGQGWRGTTRPGGFGHVLFSGSSGYVQATDAGGRLGGLPGLTLAAWVNAASTGGSGFGRILGNNDTSPYGLLVQSSTQLNFYVNNTALTASGFTLNSWHRILCTYDVATQRVYIDGVSAASASLSGAISASTSGVVIGNNTGAARGFDGPIDDVSIWDRPLSAAEARAEYDLSRSGHPGVLNRWRPSKATYLLGSVTAFDASLFPFNQVRGLNPLGPLVAVPY